MKSYRIMVTDEEGSSYVNSFEVKTTAHGAVHVAAGTTDDCSAKWWDEKSARAIAAYLRAYNPDRLVELFPC